MQQLLRLWKSLTLRQRISLVVVPLLVCALGWALTTYRHESSFRILYAGLAPEDAAAITQKIREAGIEYRLDETGAGVLVPATRFAEARMALATAGIPRTGRSGWEIFDSTNIGISDFAEKVRLQRALEGELERTVSTLAEVASSRIHLTFPKDSVFLDSRQPAKATVVLQLRRPARISQQNVMAIANLVASAVDGLLPEAVAIVDTSGRLLNRPSAGEDSGARMAEADLEYRRQVESGLTMRINTALEPLLGADRYRAGVSVDLDFTTTEENNESYDAASSAVLSSQSTEESNSATQPSGTPGTASNLPRPPARPASGASGTLRRVDNLTFQPGRTVRRVVSPRGAIRRVSTAIVIDHAIAWEGTGPKARRTLTPPSAEMLKSVHDIVAGLIGFSEQRGDQITVESVPFEVSSATGPPNQQAPAAPQAPVGFGQIMRQPQVLGIIGVVVLLCLTAGFFLFRNKRHPPLRAELASEKAALSPSPEGSPPQLTPEQRIEARIARATTEQELAEAEALSRIALPATSGRTELLVKHIRDSIAKDPSGSAGIFRAWLSDREGHKT